MVIGRWSDESLLNLSARVAKANAILIKEASDFRIFPARTCLSRNNSVPRTLTAPAPIGLSCLSRDAVPSKVRSIGCHFKPKDAISKVPPSSLHSTISSNLPSPPLPLRVNLASRAPVPSKSD